MARTVVSSDNLSPVVLIITWLLCIILVLTTLARAATKVMFTRSQSVDDLTSTFAMIFAIAQSATTSLRSSHGLGKHLATLAPSDVTAYLKSTYATEILYFPAMGLSEATALLFIWTITPVRRYQFAIMAAGGLTAAWTLVGIVVSAAQCDGPYWREALAPHGRCIDKVAFWTYVEVMDLIINLALVIIPLLVVALVRFPWWKKMSIGSIFALRLAVCAACICKLYYLNRDGRSADFTYALWPAAICSQAIICLSVSSASFLYLKPFLQTIEGGFIRTDDLRRRGQVSVNGSYNLSEGLSGSHGRERKPPVTFDWRQQWATKYEAKADSQPTREQRPASEDGSQVHIMRRTSIEITSHNPQP